MGWNWIESYLNSVNLEEFMLEFSSLTKKTLAKKLGKEDEIGRLKVHTMKVNRPCD